MGLCSSMQSAEEVCPGRDVQKKGKKGMKKSEACRVQRRSGLSGQGWIEKSYKNGSVKNKGIKKGTSK